MANKVRNGRTYILVSGLCIVEINVLTIRFRIYGVGRCEVIHDIVRNFDSLCRSAFFIRVHKAYSGDSLARIRGALETNTGSEYDRVTRI